MSVSLSLDDGRLGAGCASPDDPKVGMTGGVDNRSLRKSVVQMCTDDRRGRRLPARRGRWGDGWDGRAGQRPGAGAPAARRARLRQDQKTSVSSRASGGVSGKLQRVVWRAPVSEKV